MYEAFKFIFKSASVMPGVKSGESAGMYENNRFFFPEISGFSQFNKSIKGFSCIAGYSDRKSVV